MTLCNRPYATMKPTLSIFLLLCSNAAAADPAPAPNPIAPKPSRGFTYFNDKVSSVPWSVHIVKIDRSHTDLELHTSLGLTNSFGMAVVSDHVKTLPHSLGTPIAAINGDFYDNRRGFEGRPRDLQICRGELVSSPDGHAAFWIDPAGTPHITNVQSRLRVVWPDGTATPIGLNQQRAPDAAVLYTAAAGPSTHATRGIDLVLGRDANSPWLPLQVGRTYSARVTEVRTAANTPIPPDSMVLSLGPKLSPLAPTVASNTLIQLVIETFPDLTGAPTAIAGGPTLVQNGKAEQWSGIMLRHPRSAVAWNRDAIFLIQVDGRQSNISLGMSLSEFAAYLERLGCEQALNLDGGGSSTLWVLGNIMNNPSEGRERPAPNALVLVQKPNPAH